jgi:hypothetical protein
VYGVSQGPTTSAKSVASEALACPAPLSQRCARRDGQEVMRQRVNVYLLSHWVPRGRGGCVYSSEGLIDMDGPGTGAPTFRAPERKNATLSETDEARRRAEDYLRSHFSDESRIVAFDQEPTEFVSWEGNPAGLRGLRAYVAFPKGAQTTILVFRTPHDLVTIDQNWWQAPSP